MKREEAISCIKHELLGTVNRKDLTGEAIGEALDMAIEALCREQKEEDLAKDIARRMATIIENEQDMRVILKSTEPTDLISRQALCEYALNQKDKAVTPNDIMRFPSADRPSGEWIYDGVRIASDEESRLYWKCSECGHEGNPDANYCGFCGAKMGGE